MTQILNLSQQLIALETIAGNTQAMSQALELVQSELDSFNVKPFYHKGVESLLFSNTDTIPDKFTVILNAHLDVVAGNHDQFIPKIKGDKLWGRGAYDMKAAAAVEILAFKHIAPKLNFPLGLQIVTDEEQGIDTSTHYQLTKGVSADFALVGESSSCLNIKYAAKGIIWANITFQGKDAHAAYPWQGQNAITQAAQFIKELETLVGKPKAETDHTTVNVSKITTNNPTNNRVPDHCQVTLDIRVAPEDESSIIQTIKAVLPKSAKLQIILNEKASWSDPQSPFIQSLHRVTQKHYPNSKLTKAHGTSDIRFYTAAGSAGVEFGPIGDGAHEAKEWVSIQSLETYYHTLVEWLQNLNQLHTLHTQN